MGKQARRKRERPPGEAKALRYLNRAGLPDRPDPGPWRRLAAADPDWFRRITDADEAALELSARGDAGGEAVSGGPGASPEVLAATRARYRLVYRDLDTALAEYASRPVMIAAAWLRWWLEHHPPAARLLDVGCGPGVLTCAYGLALPDAEVVGIDAVPEAVDRARELADRVGARNVTFVAGDFLDPGVGGDGFDQVVAVTALGEAGLYPPPAPDGAGPDGLSSLADVDGAAREFTSPAAAGLVGRLSPGGTMLVLDRTPDAAQAVRLGAALLHAGVDLDLRRSGVEVFVEEGRPTTFTRFAGVRPAGPAGGDADLPAWVRRAAPPAYGPAWHDELRFEALKAAGARLVWGCEIDYAPHSPTLERREIWDLDGEVYGWVTTTVRFRELVAGRTAESLWTEYGAYAGRFAAGGLRVRFYDTP